MLCHWLSVVTDCLSCHLQLELSARLERERLEASLVEPLGWDHPVASAAVQFNVCWLLFMPCKRVQQASAAQNTATKLCCQADTAMDVCCTGYAAQELSRLSMECGQLRAAAEETRAAADEARRGRAALQVSVHRTCTKSPIALAAPRHRGERVCSLSARLHASLFLLDTMLSAMFC